MPSDQKQFETSNAGASQCDAILGVLQERRDWVSILELHQLTNSMAVHSRIAELRKRGHVIHNRTRTVLSSSGGRQRWIRASEYMWISFDPSAPNPNQDSKV
jgi:hypothetical protein